MSVTNNSPSQDSYHPDDLFQSRNVMIIVVQHSMSQVTITTSLSGVLKIFSYCVWWFHMHYGLY